MPALLILADIARTFRSYTNIVFDAITRTQQFNRALCRTNQLILDNFYEAILNHRSAISSIDSLLPIKLPFVILLDHRVLVRFDEQI